MSREDFNIMLASLSVSSNRTRIFSASRERDRSFRKVM